MSPFMTWLADHLGTVLIAGLLLALAAMTAGVFAAFRTGRRLRGPQRPWLRFALSVVLILAGIGAALFLGTGLVQLGPALRFQRGMIGQPSPELAYRLVESDRPERLAELRGQVVLLNIWATWCPPCIKEMPELERLQRVHADAGLVVLHLSDEDRGTLLAWLEKRSEPAVHAYARPLPWPEPGRPTTFVVDRQGVVRRVLLGARSYEQFEAAIEEHL